jgi:hypothetical protein
MLMLHDELVRIAWWAIASVAAAVVSLVSLVVDASAGVGDGLGAAVLGVGGLVGLVALLWKLATDYRSSSNLIANYRTMLDDERQEAARLREEIRDLRGL